MTERLLKIDRGVLLVSLVMLGFGIVFVYSSSFAIANKNFGGADYFLARHMVRAIVALFCFVIFINIDYHVLGKLSTLAYLGAIIMLVYVLSLPESAAVNGAKRWISIGFLRFQVSEFAKIALIISLAMQLDKHGERIKEGNIFLQQIIKIGLLCLLIILEPDFSTAALIGVVALIMLFVSGAQLLHIGGILLSFIPIIIIAIVNSPYRLKRVLGFLNAADNKDGIGYQTYQSIIGLGHGGLLGAGLGQGEQKYFFLPEPHTDFVFSILGEEIGFVGLIVVFSLFGVIILRGMRIAMKAPDKMGQAMAFGISLMIGMYVVLHACVNTGIVPTTGVPLPFLSYGGMSLVFTMSSVGILLNISSQARDMGMTNRIGRAR